MHYEAGNGNLSVMKWLKREGIPIDEIDDSGLTPLDYAQNNGHFDVVNWLMQDKDDINEEHVASHVSLNYADIGIGFK